MSRSDCCLARSPFVALLRSSSYDKYLQPIAPIQTRQACVVWPAAAITPIQACLWADWVLYEDNPLCYFERAKWATYLF